MGENNYNYNGYGAPMSPQTGGFVGGAKIKVIGIGGAGNNAVNRLIESGLQGAEFIALNTDIQDLTLCKAQTRVQIGADLTKGLGAGADANIGKKAAETDEETIKELLRDTDLLFITAGMGGGTGTGAAPVVARIAQEMDILTVAVVTLPFSFEAHLRMDNAMRGVDELKKYVDALITIPNDKISQVVAKGTSLPEALRVADEVLRQGIRGITELITKSSLINLDFADVRTTLKGRGLAHMGIGVAKGEMRIYEAVRCAVCSPLLNTTIEGATAVIINVIGGTNLGLDEVSIAANLIKDVIDYSANVIFGASIDENMGDEVEIVVIATGFGGSNNSVGTDPQNAALRQVSTLSRRLDDAYNRRGNAGNTPEPNFSQPIAPMGNQKSNGQTPYNNLANYQTPMQEMYTKPNNAFEPDDPILEDPKDRKHRPRFVDFFMKQNQNQNPDEE